jgi:hypothetical protein
MGNSGRPSKILVSWTAFVLAITFHQCFLVETRTVPLNGDVFKAAVYEHAPADIQPDGGLTSVMKNMQVFEEQVEIASDQV